MKSSFGIGKVKGIKIEINISWFIILALITFTLATSYFPLVYPDWNTTLRWSIGFAIALLFFISVLLHELSHSIVSIRNGIKVGKITLFIFGGMALMEKAADDPKKDLKISAAGPAMSLFLFLLFVFFSFILTKLNAPQPFIVMTDYLSNTNLILALFNLVPAYPMDGGRILMAIIWYFSGRMQYALKIASTIGSAFGYLLIIIGVVQLLLGNLINGIWIALIGIFINQAARSSYDNTVITDIFNKIRVSEFMTDSVVTVESDITIRDFIDKYLYKYKFPCFPVKSNQKIIGVVSVESVKMIGKETWNKRTVGDIIIPLTYNLMVSPDDTVSDALIKIFSNKVGRVLVMEQENLMGIISKTDILDYITIHNQVE